MFTLWRLLGVLNIHVSRLNTIQHVVLAILISELDSISESSQDNQTGERKLSLFIEDMIFYTKKVLSKTRCHGLALRSQHLENCAWRTIVSF